MRSLNIVAHEDDDLLFLNPDIANDIIQGDDVFNVYMTLGDDGRGMEYVELRKHGLIAAYELLGEYEGHGTYYPFIFPIRSTCYRIGDKHGDLCRVFEDAKYQTVPFENLVVLDQSEIIEMLRMIHGDFQPQVIRVQDPNAVFSFEPNTANLEHPDHVYGARLAVMALQGQGTPIEVYSGYNLRNEVATLDATAIALKTKMWRAYQEWDKYSQGEIWDDVLNKCSKRSIGESK